MRAPRPTPDAAIEENSDAGSPPHPQRTPDGSLFRPCPPPRVGFVLDRLFVDRPCPLARILLPTKRLMGLLPRMLVTLLLAVLLGTAGASPADAGSPSSPAAPSPVVCEDFAQRQVRLANNLRDKRDYPGALRVLNRAGSNCDIELVRNAVAETLNAWYDYIQRTNRTSAIPRFIRAVAQEEYLSRGARARLERRLTANTEQVIAGAHRSENYESAYELCRTYARYSDRTFAMNYYCATAAREVQAYSAAISRYEWVLDNWSAGQSLTTWSEAAQNLQRLYLITTRFDPGYALLQKMARRNTEPETLIASLVAVRGKYLEPIPHAASVFFSRNGSDDAVGHVKREMSRISFPDFVESVYLLRNGPGVAFYQEANAVPPSSDLLQRAAGSVSLLQATDDSGRAWLVAPVDDGHFILQFGRQTASEENVILESVLSDVESDTKWQRVRDYEFNETFPAVGSAVATILGGTYLAGGSVGAYNSIFDAIPVLSYYCVQNGSGEIVVTHDFSRGAMTYDEGAWAKSSETPALFYHTVQQSGTPLQEVVWPTYDGEQWAGVIRVGLDAN